MMNRGGWLGTVAVHAALSALVVVAFSATASGCGGSDDEASVNDCVDKINQVVPPCTGSNTTLSKCILNKDAALCGSESRGVLAEWAACLRGKNECLVTFPDDNSDVNACNDAIRAKYASPAAQAAEHAHCGVCSVCSVEGNSYIPFAAFPDAVNVKLKSCYDSAYNCTDAEDCAERAIGVSYSSCY
jgi:hypothetical protein